jgi:hypothetical protein
LETLQISTAWVWFLVLDGAGGLSSQVVSLSMVAQLLEGHVDAAAANGVR